MQVNLKTLGWRDAADVALQRTDWLISLPVIGCVSYRAWCKNVPQVLYAEAMLRRRAILAGAFQDAEREFIELRRYLKGRQIDRMMDIGCGHAFIDVPFYQEYSCQLHLVDIEFTPQRYHGWSSQGAGYASLASARRLLTSNSVPADKIQTTNPFVSTLQDENVDLIISLLSAGFHYPVDEYASFALSALKPGGVFIFDARKGRNPEGALAGFSGVEVISEQGAHYRLAAIR